VRGGPLQKVKIDEAMGPAPGRRKEADGEAAAAPQIDATREAATAAARQARTLIQRGGASPARLAVPRMVWPKAADEGAGDAKRPRPRAKQGAAADTTR